MDPLSRTALSLLRPVFLASVVDFGSSAAKRMPYRIPLHFCRACIWNTFLCPGDVWRAGYLPRGVLLSLLLLLLHLGDAWPVEAVATAALEPSGWAIDEGVVTIRTAVLWRRAMSNITLIVSCLSAATAAASHGVSCIAWALRRKRCPGSGARRRLR